MELTSDQEHALDRIKTWYREKKRDRKYLTLGGYAGTGKTTIIAQLRRELPSAVIRYCSFTAKAAAVLRDSLRDAGVEVETEVERRNGETRVIRYVSTVHSLIKYHREITYCVTSGAKLSDSRDSTKDRDKCGSAACDPASPCRAYTDKSQEWEPRPQHELAGVDLIVLDEASMIGEQLWTDLLSYDVPVLAVGDHGQLPPVGENAFNLMDERRLDIRLERIHRQVESSPIIQVATLARERGHVPYGVWDSTPGQVVAKLTHDEATRVDVDFKNFTDIITLCGRNRTRAEWNRSIRAAIGREGLVQVGDRVTCLRNSTNVYNGALGTVTHAANVGNGGVDLGIRVDGTDEDEDDLRVRVALDQFGRENKMTYDELRTRKLTGLGLWDFGYVTTVHKAQGSSIDRVIVLEERLPGGLEKHKRWLYTAVTRARRQLLIIG